MSFEEKRKAPRLRILDTFSVFVSVPKKSPARLIVHNVSASGISMNVDVEGEPSDTFPIQVGEKLPIDLFLNPTLSIPLTVQVMRLDDRQGEIRAIGAEIVVEESPGFSALQGFVKLIDELAKAKGLVLHA